MSNREVLQTIGLMLIAFSLAGCGDNGDYLTVSQTWQNAESLDGERIRVRGQAYFRIIPYPGLLGWCVPDGGEDTVGKLELLDENSPDPRYYTGDRPLPRLSISESTLQCQGNQCRMTCTPFDPQAAEVFEFVGTLRTGDQQGDAELVLENIDVKVSRQLLDEEWVPIQTGNFSYFFP
jgi:hypothetical protein